MSHSSSDTGGNLVHVKVKIQLLYDKILAAIIKQLSTSILPVITG